MKIAVSLMVLSLFVSGCMFSNCERKDIPVRYKSWLKKYKIAQKMAYQSNLGNTDTLIVTNLSDSYTSCNKLERSEYQFNVVDVSFKSINFGQYIYAMYTAMENNSVTRSFKFIDLSGHFGESEIKTCLDKIKIQSISDSIPVFTINKQNTFTSNNTKIVSFSWSEMYGIVRYETRDEEVFELVK